MPDGSPAAKLVVFLPEDNRLGPARWPTACSSAPATQSSQVLAPWRASEGFGASRHLRSEHQLDLARRLPLLVEIIDEDDNIASFVDVVRELAPGAHVTIEQVRVSRSRDEPG